MATYAEVSPLLDKALTDVANKKAALDKATEAVQAANNQYLDALNTARVLKAKMNEVLDSQVPDDSTSTRVR